jgi:hypothetical protein
LSGNDYLGSDEASSWFVVARVFFSDVELRKARTYFFEGKDLVLNLVGSRRGHGRCEEIIDPMMAGLDRPRRQYEPATCGEQVSPGLGLDLAPELVRSQSQRDIGGAFTDRLTSNPCIAVGGPKV